MERARIKENLDEILKGNMIIQYSTTLRLNILGSGIFKYKCNKCGIESWNGNPITLEIEHKDGDSWNNKQENLELLCPNCHSQTSTFRKRKNVTSNKQIKDEEILEQLKICNNINKVLINLGLSNSGGNYKRVHELIRINGLNSFYELPEIVKKSKKYIKSHRDLFGERIQIIKDSNIDFNSYGWGVKLGEHLGLTPAAALYWVKKNIPEFHKDCFQHNS